MPRGAGSSTRAPLSQEYIHSSDDDEDVDDDGDMSGPASEVSSHGTNGVLEALKDHSGSPAKQRGPKVSLGVSAAESDNELETALPEKTKEDSLPAVASSTTGQKGKSITANLPNTGTKAGAIPVKPYKAPLGFIKSRKPSRFSEEIAEAFTDIEGKQIYHIVAPSSLPMSKIKQLDFSALKTGASAIDYRGKTYCLSESKSSSRGDQLNLPSLHGDEKFNRLSSSISRTYVFKESAKEEDSLFSSYINGTWKTAGSVSQPRKEQRLPTRLLKYRYTPFGVSATPPATDLDSSEEQPRFRAPTRIKTPPTTTHSVKSEHTTPRSTYQKSKPSDGTPPDEAQRRHEMATETPASTKRKKKRKYESQEETLPIRTPSKEQDVAQSSKARSEKKKKKRKELEGA